MMYLLKKSDKYLYKIILIGNMYSQKINFFIQISNHGTVYGTYSKIKVTSHKTKSDITFCF